MKASQILNIITYYYYYYYYTTPIFHPWWWVNSMFTHHHLPHTPQIKFNLFKKSFPNLVNPLPSHISQLGQNPL